MEKIITYFKKKPMLAVYALVVLVLIGIQMKNQYRDYQYEKAAIRGKQINDSLKKVTEERELKEKIAMWGPNYQYRIDSVNKAASKANVEKQEAAQRKAFGEKAWKLHKKHPEWTLEDCRDVVNGKVWIGMNIEMLVYRWGNPDVKNVSNYGSGNRYQYGWHDYTPTYFYCGEDGIVTQYN
jgi:hypothetical protein